MKKKFFRGVLVAFLLMVPGIVKADFAGCLFNAKNDMQVSVGETFTFDIGSDGLTDDVYGVHMVLYYDPEALEPVTKDFKSYYSWEQKNITDEDQYGTYYRKLTIDMKTSDQNKYVTGDYSASEYVKLINVKFRVKNTTISTSTRVNLIPATLSISSIISLVSSGVLVSYLYLLIIRNMS